MRRQFGDSHGNADRNLYQRVAAVTRIAADRAANPVGNHQCGVHVHLRQQYGKFVAAVTHQHVTRPELLLQDA